MSMMVEIWTPKVNNFVFTNNLSTHSAWGFLARRREGTAALNTNFTNWTFSKNVLVAGRQASYPAGNFFPNTLATVRFVNYAGGNFALAANSPYRNWPAPTGKISAQISLRPLHGRSRA